MPVRSFPTPLPLVAAAELQELLTMYAERALEQSGGDPEKAALALVRLVAGDTPVQKHLMQLGAQELVREILSARGGSDPH
jgi:hypothetical protein